MKTTPCKGCGKPIVWAKDEKGTSHPLDARAPVYHFNGGDLDAEFTVYRLTGAWVSHFATCPKDTAAATAAFLAERDSRVRAEAMEEAERIGETLENHAEGVEIPTWNEGVNEGFYHCVRVYAEAIRARAQQGRK